MKKFVLAFYTTALFLILIGSLYAWFTWGLMSYLWAVGALAAISLFALWRDAFSFTKWNIIAVIFLTLFEFYIYRAVSTVVIVGVTASLLMLRDGLKVKILAFFTKGTAVIVGVSMIAWLLFLVGVRLPYETVLFENGEYVLDNYWLFIYNPLDITYNMTPRFSSVFIEPGHLGLVASFLLMANRYEVKKPEVLILIIANLITLSLASYILMFVSIAVVIISKAKRPVISLLYYIGIVALLAGFFTVYKSGENVINKIVIERLYIKDGDIQGNNRTTEKFEDSFREIMSGELSVDSNNDKNPKLLGIGAEAYAKLKLSYNSGYKVYLIQYGYLGLILCLLFYVSMACGYRSFLTLSLFALYALSFLQREYTFWPIEIFIFAAAMPALERYKFPGTLKQWRKKTIA